MPAKNPLPDLSRAEYSILKVLWEEKELTVREVHDQLSPIHHWAYSTTKTMMDRMVGKGLLERKSFHGIFLYKPLISRPAGLVKIVQFFADRVLEMDYGSVVSLFAHSNSFSAEEIEELSNLLKEEQQKEG